MMRGSPYVFGPGAPLAFAGAPAGNASTFIGGALPWDSTPSPAPTSLPGLTANYQSEYAKSMNMNAANYGNILAGYQNLIAQQNTGYTNLYNTVMNQLQGAETSRKTEIGDMAKSELGSASQSLIDRGLGNTTVQSAVSSGVEANKQRRLTEVANQFAQMRAGYQQQLGQAQLGNIAGLSKAQLDFMNSVNAGYPDAGMYGQLAMMFGQAAGAGAGGYDKGRGPGYTGPSMPYGGFGLGGPKLGYTPAASPYFGGSGFNPAPVSTGGSYNMMGAPAAFENWNVPNGSYADAFGQSSYGGLAGGLASQFTGGMAGGFMDAGNYGGMASAFGEYF